MEVVLRNVTSYEAISTCVPLARVRGRDPRIQLVDQEVGDTDGLAFSHAPDI
jgi:hypothetical protein